ncbi:MAG: hypothetical protein J0I40_12015 [Cellulomonas sp.]|uniref:hypothetical protein n=1 Tax=Cellulomonas sp. 73-92 TaxID=1895740 RepID=UPI000B104123|nr:hypothetical protein [Cellulomonas sp. 73-92]MBN9376086.1 hypothetical protein [Cellulomonas sp.]
MNAMTSTPPQKSFAPLEPPNGVASGLLGVVVDAILVAGAALRLALVVASVAVRKLLPVLRHLRRRRQDTAVGTW